MKSQINNLFILRMCFVLFSIFLGHNSVVAHEIRPAYLELTEMSPGKFSVLWKQAVKQGRWLRVDPVLPEHCHPTTAPVTDMTSEARIQRWIVDCGPARLDNEKISIAGLSHTLIDVLVRVQFHSGASLSVILAPDQPSFVAAPKKSGVPWDYLKFGIQHLLSGLDHIWFVIGLMFLVQNPASLIKTITSFTVAHSITLGLSILELVRLPQSPVEAVIALSLLVLAVELTRLHQKRGVTARYPWIMAFAFGLLHGFGFAGALSDIGLPGEAVLLPLFLFNVGVEIGQLVIVAAMRLLRYLVIRSQLEVPPLLARAPIYGMGVMSAYWTMQRLW